MPVGCSILEKNQWNPISSARKRPTVILQPTVLPGQSFSPGCFAGNPQEKENHLPDVRQTMQYLYQYQALRQPIDPLASQLQLEYRIPFCRSLRHRLAILSAVRLRLNFPVPWQHPEHPMGQKMTGCAWLPAGK